MCNFTDEGRLCTFVSTPAAAAAAGNSRSLQLSSASHCRPRPSQYKSHLPGHSPLGRLGKMPYWVSSLRPSASVVATAARYVQKAGSPRELAEVPHNLRLALSVQEVVGAPGNKQFIY